MKWIKTAILLIFLYAGTNKQLYLGSAKQKTEDSRVVKVANFLKSYNSPFVYLAPEFVKMADENGLDYRLLPVVSCVESSCGKHYSLNAFGWGSDSLDFGSDREDLDHIAARIGTLPYYKTYKKTKNLHDFAVAYNAQYSESYYKKLEYFWERIK